MNPGGFIAGLGGPIGFDMDDYDLPDYWERLNGEEKKSDIEINLNSLKAKSKP